MSAAHERSRMLISKKSESCTHYWMKHDCVVIFLALIVPTTDRIACITRHRSKYTWPPSHERYGKSAIATLSWVLESNFLETSIFDVVLRLEKHDHFVGSTFWNPPTRYSPEQSVRFLACVGTKKRESTTCSLHEPINKTLKYSLYAELQLRLVVWPVSINYWKYEQSCLTEHLAGCE